MRNGVMMVGVWGCRFELEQPKFSLRRWESARLHSRVSYVEERGHAKALKQEWAAGPKEQRKTNVLKARNGEEELRGSGSQISWVIVRTLDLFCRRWGAIRNFWALVSHFKTLDTLCSFFKLTKREESACIMVSEKYIPIVLKWVLKGK